MTVIKQLLRTTIPNVIGILDSAPTSHHGEHLVKRSTQLLGLAVGQNRDDTQCSTLATVEDGFEGVTHEAVPRAIHRLNEREGG
jgi:hypothetical protein